MKFLIVFVALFALAVAAPTDHAEVIHQTSDVQPESFKHDLEQSDGTAIHSEGQLKNAGTEHEAIVVHGSYSWVSKEGEKFTVEYTADENGFQPKGAHLPTPP